MQGAVASQNHHPEEKSMCLLSETKIKKQNKQSQVGPGIHFPCDVPGPPMVISSSPSIPICSTVCSGGLSEGIYLYGIKTLLSISRAWCFHVMSAFSCTLFLGRRRVEGGFWFPSSLQGFSFPVFSNLLTVLKSSPSSYFCYEAFLTLQVPSPWSSCLSPPWQLGCRTSYSDHLLPWFHRLSLEVIISCRLSVCLILSPGSQGLWLHSWHRR